MKKPSPSQTAPPGLSRTAPTHAHANSRPSPPAGLNARPGAPSVAQPKSQPNRNTPAAPPVYRPQAPPRVLQTKACAPRAAVKPPATAPPFKRANVAPPVLQTRTTPTVLQTKTPTGVPSRPHANHFQTLQRAQTRVKTPPRAAQRPAAAPQVAQPKAFGVLRSPTSGRTAPASASPATRAPKVLQAKVAHARAQFALLPATSPRLAAVQLKRQPGVAPTRAGFGGGRGVIQRILDEDFEHGGTPGEGETAACHAFAQRVSDFVDQTYRELITGNVGAWKGAKAATFLGMVIKGHRTAKTHAANAIEERVYALMKENGMPLKWVPQFTEGMGSASKPDIVIHLDSGAEALVDITSERGHILRKAGGWTTSERYVYVAEAYFNPIRERDIPNIKSAMQKGGIGEEEALLLKRAADEERLDKLRKKKEETEGVREEFNEYGNFAQFAMNNPRFGHLPKSSRATAAMLFLRRHGVIVKGMRRLKGRRKPSIETRKKMNTKARKMRARKEKLSVGQALKELQGAQKQVVIKEFLK